MLHLVVALNYQLTRLLKPTVARRKHAESNGTVSLVLLASNRTVHESESQLGRVGSQLLSYREKIRVDLAIARSMSSVVDIDSLLSTATLGTRECQPTGRKSTDWTHSGASCRILKCL